MAKHRFIVVGGGLAGLAAIIKLAEAGHDVDVFSFVPCRRSHSVCAQGGINGAVNTKGEGDSTWEHFDDTVYGGDFLANQPPVKAMCEAAPGIIYLLDRMGVPFNRTPEGLIDFRRFGGTKHHRTAYAGATTGQQLLYALDEQVRRHESEGRVRRFEYWEMVHVILDDGGRCRGIVAMDLHRMTLEAFPAAAVILATGGPGIVFGKSTNSIVNTGTAASLVYQQGATYANGEFIQVHPTSIPGADKLRLMSESLRGEGGRVWVPSDGGFDERAKKQRPPKGEPWYFLEDRYPAYGNLVPRDIATREIFNVCRELHLGVDGGDQVYLDLTHLGRKKLEEKLKGVVEIYEKFVGDDPARVPMKVFPGMHYSMGGLWVDYDQMTPVPGLFAAGEVDYQYHGANRLGANSLVSCIFGGFVAGPAAVRYANAQKGEVSSALLDSSLKDMDKRYFGELAKMDGPENPYQLGWELGDWMTGNCTVVRYNDKLKKTEEKIVELMDRWHKVAALDASRAANQSLMYVRQLWNMLVLARVMVRGAFLRDESRGAHFKPDFPARDDARFLKTTMARYDAATHEPKIEYQAVDTTLIPPRERKYDTEKKTATPADTKKDRVKTIRLRIKRQADREAAPRWEEFEVALEPQLNVIAALMQIQRKPQTAGGGKTTPVAWDSNCLEEVCGACTMLVNGRVRQACSTLVEKAAAGATSMTLEPMSKFPVVRDLIVNRARMFDSLKRVKAWIQLDGSYDLGPGPRYSQDQWANRYDLSRCFTCGSCLEVCPQVTPTSKYIGPAAVSQARLMNLHPTGKLIADERIEALMGEGGVLDCGNSQNCVRVCPKEVPLTTSLAEMMRAATVHSLVRWFKR